MDHEIVQDESKEKLIRLETCEARIQDAFRRGLEAKHDCARELITIEEEALYEAKGYSTFTKYVEEVPLLNRAAARTMMDSYRAVQALNGSGLALPTNESQLLELTKVEEERVPVIWDRVLRICAKHDKPITITAIRKAVKLDEPEPAKAKPGVKVPIEINLPALDEEGERALNKIRRICGEQVAKAIESGVLQLSEKSILKWAEQNDLMMKNLVHYIVDLRWSVKDAIDYEEKLPTGSTTLDSLITLARARGGRVVIQHNEFRITIEQMEVEAA